MSEGEDGRDVGNGWFAYLTEEGDEYYYNEELDETLWELPPSISGGSEQTSEQAETSTQETSPTHDEQHSQEEVFAEEEQESSQEVQRTRTASRPELLRKQSSNVDKDDVVRPTDPERSRRLTVDEVNSMHAPTASLEPIQDEPETETEVSPPQTKATPKPLPRLSSTINDPRLSLESIKQPSTPDLPTFAAAGNSDSENMPEDAVIEKMYVKVLESLMMPAATIQKLVEKETIEKKWKMIGMHGKQLADVNVQQLMMFNDKDKQMMDVLQSTNSTMKTPGHEVVNSLKLALRQPTKVWFDGFVNSKGVMILMESIKARLAHHPASAFDAVVLLEFLECFKFIMKDNHGMETVINTTGAIGTITMCLDFKWDRVALAVMEILSVTCFSSELGHSMVLDSLDRLFRRRMEKPFASIVAAISEKPMKVKVAAMTLINTLINHAAEIDDRLRIRNYMASLELFVVWEDVLTGAPKEEIKEEEDEVRMSTISTGLLDEEGRKADPFGRKIAPNLGVMAGPCFYCPLTLGAANQKAKIRPSIFGGAAPTKPEVIQYWYGLSDDSLQWYKYKGGTYTSTKPEGSLKLNDILDIRAETMNGDLKNFDPANTIWGLDIVCENKIMSLGLQSEEAKSRWFTALTVAWDYVRMKSTDWSDASQRSRAATCLDLNEYKDHQDMIEKQVEVFEAIYQADQQQTVMKSFLNIDSGNFREIADFVMQNLENDGMTDKLMDLFHQLILMPTAGIAGEEAWTLLLQSCKDIRGIKRSEKKEIQEGEHYKVQIRRRSDWKIDYSKMENLIKAQQEQNSATGRVSMLELLVQKNEAELKKLREQDITENSQFIVYKTQFENKVQGLKEEMNNLKDQAVKDAEANAKAEAEAKGKGNVEEFQKQIDEYKATVEKLKADLAMAASTPPAAPSPAAARATAPAAPTKIKLKDHPKYAKYFKMTKMGLPVGAAVGRATQDGVDAAEIDGVLNRDPEEMIDDPDAAATSPPAPTGGGGGGPGLTGLMGGRGGGGRGAMLAGIGGRGGGGGRGTMLAGIGGRGGGVQTREKKASVTAEDIGLKAKPKVEPAKKLKSLFWSKVQPKTMAGTVWMVMQENQKIDFKDLENDFFDPAKARVKESESREQDEKKKKPEKPKAIILVDPKRNQNVSIALARFKASNEELKRKVIAFDPMLINSETIGKLQMMIPEEEEINTINDFDGDKNMLGKVEKFYLEMVKIPRLKMRLDCVSQTLQFDESYALLQKKMQKFTKATKELKDSKNFLEVLSMVMAIGNYMNGSTTRGQAHGFKLDVLGKLTNMKANDRKKGTLMNFLLKQIEKQRKTLLELPSELPSIEAAAVVSLNQMETDFKQLSLGVKKVRNEYNKYEALEVEEGTKPEDNAVASFKSKMEPFLLKSEEACTRFAEAMTDMKMKIIANMESFGDKIGGTDKFSPDKSQMFYQNLANFLKAFKQAKVENEQMRIQAEKEAKRAKEKAAKEKKKGGGEGGGAEEEKKCGPGKKDLFAAFKTAQAGNTDDIVNEFQARLAKRRTNNLDNLP
ncbi:hypothetical protein TrLO_g4004 [Triparma laevis f. longispina]|uniref:Formin-like protein n=1 Tax=Triparma laevis f. longispina TaxID=1714387 RepID=A0A9W7AD82_9STRA|nr:hypothetical protein TrLO_g4004 [Triparma laevis f. longispina]